MINKFVTKLEKGQKKEKAHKEEKEDNEENFHELELSPEVNREEKSWEI